MIKFGYYEIDAPDLEEPFTPRAHNAELAKRALAAAVADMATELSTHYQHVGGALATKLLARAIRIMETDRQQYNAQKSAEKVAEQQIAAAELALKAAYVNAKRNS